MLASLVDVVTRELACVDVPGRALRGKALPAPPVPRLRQLGRELDTSASLLPAVLDGETPVLIRCLLDLTAVYQYLDGERGVAALARLQVDPGKVRWRDVDESSWNNQTILGGGSAEARARGRKRAAQQRAARRAVGASA